MKGRAATPTPSRCTSGRWRSASSALGPDHPDTATSLNNLAVALSGAGPHRRCVAAGGTDDRKRTRAAARRASGAVRRAAATIDADREGAGRCAQRGSARHPVIGRFRREQARGAAGRRKRSPRGTGAPGSGPRRRGRDAGQGDRCGGLQGAVEARRGCRAAQPGTGLPPFPPSARACKKPLPAEFPDYAALSNPLPMTAKEIQALLSGDEAMVLFAVADKESYVVCADARGFRLEADSARRGGAVAEGCRVPPRSRCRQAPAMRPASPDCSIWRSPMNCMRRCWGRSSRWSRTSAVCWWCLRAR